MRDPMKRAMREILRRGKEEGRFRQDIDETQLLLTIFACCFNYFSNIYTLTRVLSADLMAEEQIQKRVDSITEMILTYILAEPKAAVKGAYFNIIPDGKKVNKYIAGFANFIAFAKPYGGDSRCQFRRQTLGEKSIIIGKISRRPTSIVMLSTSLEKPRRTPVSRS